MKCKTCKKDITALNHFLKVEYCSKKCEKKSSTVQDELSKFFGGFKK